ncbi:MAG: acetate--CoA ligase family protein [Alphaproteobacteria bacterium]
MSYVSIDPQSIRPFFHAQSIAVLGASTDPGKIGGRPVHYLKEFGYKGAIYPVNPRADEVQGLKAYPSVTAIGAPIDLALIIVGADLVKQAVEECAEAGVKTAILMSSGFAETGEEGRRHQEEIRDLAQARGIRLTGPNTVGLVNVIDRVIATFSAGVASGMAEPGRVAIVSQSGAFGSYCFALARERGIGVSYLMTTGNECDVELADGLAFMAEDPNTDVICAYIEGVRDGRKFMEALDLCKKRGKKVIAVKVGRSDAGARAAASHTGSLVGTDAVYDAVFERYNVYRAQSIDELFDVAHACTHGHFPPGRKVGLFTISGGAGVLMADEAASLGLDVVPIPEATRAKMLELVPFAGVNNPVDTTAQVLNDMSLVQRFLRLMIEECGYDVIVAALLHTGLVKELAGQIRDSLKEVQADHPDKLIAVAMLTGPGVKQEYERDGFPVFEDPTRAVRAAAALCRISAGLGDIQTAAPPALPAGAEKVPAGRLNEVEAKRILGSAGIPVVEETVAEDADMAAEAAARIGYPVVLKIASPDIRHKSEIGGVLLGIANEAALRAGFATIMERARAAEPKAAIDGVLVAPMVGGVEMILGVRSDPIFGPVVMCGLGGIFVEVMKDVALRVAPFGEDVARAMIDSLKGAPLLKGARERAKADIDALAKALARLSVFAAENADALDSIDINPFIVRAEGEGAVAVDALIVPASG